MSRMIRLFPRSWRDRYGDEFEALLAARPPSARDRVDIVMSAVDARIDPQVGVDRPPVVSRPGPTSQPGWWPLLPASS